MDNYKGILYAILSSLAYAIMPIFAKVAYDSGSNSTSALIFRFLIAGVVLLIYLKIKKINLKISFKQFFIFLSWVLWDIQLLQRHYFYLIII